jgi:Zn-dependent M28 family amino/carboxypeptidase
MGCVDEAHLKGDVTFIAAPRLPKSPHWQEVQDLCAERFAQYGFEVELHNYATGVNVIGKRIGATQPDEQVIVSAHYDHIANCSGADDNATGVAAVLETARVLEGATLSRTLILACWDEEEAGLLGSLAYAARAKANGDKIVAISAFDMIGFKNDAPNSQKIPSGFDVLFPQQYAAVAANDFRADFVSLVALDSAAPLADAFVARTKQVGPASSLITLTPDMAGSPQLSDLSRSDHAAFWLNGFPALLVTDSSNFRYPQYHCRNGDDVPSLLNFGFLTGITRASVGAHLDIIGLNQ